MIVLYNPHSTTSPHVPLPLSLLAVASTLEGEHAWEIVDGNVERDPVGRIEQLARRPGGLTALGVTVMPGPQLERAYHDTVRLRAVLPGVPIVWGGYFPSEHPELVLRHGAIDFVVRGQGERAFRDLIDTLAAGGDLGAIPGLWWRADGGGVRDNGAGPLLDLDALPDWPYERLELERYLHAHYLGRRVTGHQSSYGCPFACGFCAVVPLARRRWVAQSAGRLADLVLGQQERWGVDAVQFYDMDFFISEDRAAEFAERVTGRGLAWWGLGRTDVLLGYEDRTLDRLRRSGLKMIFSGAESGSDATLADMGKGSKARSSNALRLAERLRPHGIVPEFSFVLGSPPDPTADLDATLEQVRRLKEVHPDTVIVFYLYAPVQTESALFDEARASAFRFPERLEDWMEDPWRRFSLRRDPHAPWQDRELLRRVRDFETVLNASHPTVTDLKIGPVGRRVLRALGGWRYRLGVYGHPVELRIAHRLLRYRRPEVEGF